MKKLSLTTERNENGRGKDNKTKIERKKNRMKNFDIFELS